MSDLRTRIVSALQLASDRQIGWRGILDCVDLADAVIRELALRRDERDGRIIYNGFGQPINVIKPKYRYVTEWTADD